jgi:L-ascorbate metabolism protein UlaG (beta-lactamase superfamily)/quercetin dioxygenase-like cupin family protein
MKPDHFAFFLLQFMLCLNLEAQQGSDPASVFATGVKGSSNNFTGNVWVNSLVKDSADLNAIIGSVSFQPGSRTHWHYHPSGQALLVTHGLGNYQEKGKPIQKIRKGDVIQCPSNVLHWHGASPDSAMSHISINTNLQKPVVIWMQAVSEQEYQSAAVEKTDSVVNKAAKKYQAKAPKTQPFGAEAFGKSNNTTLRWLGMAGFFVNSRGTTLMIDPLLRDFDMPVLIDFPIATKAVPRLDAVLVTHADNDHYSVPTNRDLKAVTLAYHSTRYVDTLMKKEKLPSHGHNIGDTFNVGNVRVSLTPADHAYQNYYPGSSDRWFRNEDASGFWIETPDGTIWAQGDSRLLAEHLNFPQPDAILFDFSDSEWHFTLAGAVKIANTYPNTPLLLNHWGSVDAADFSPFNADPEVLKQLIVNPERIHVLAPGEPFKLKRVKK